ncbi:MAG: outer membrane protein assembly factor BamD [Candidatus Eisenbacteria bacterium]|nr:outer membrane protein assembly factor BamD [Candidatus Eisenbacteria bacterium]
MAALLGAAFLVMTGCAPVPELGEATAEDTYALGVEAAEAGDYLLAIESFRRITIGAPDHETADDALIALADAHRAMSDYASAQESYRLLLSDYGDSPLAPAARHRLCLTRFDIGVEAARHGNYTLAIESFRDITLETPLHEIADDALVALADAHRAIADYASAEEEYRALLLDYPHSPLVPEAEYKLGMTFFDQMLPVGLDQSMTEQAISQFEYFVAAFPSSEFADEAAGKILELRTRLAAKRYDSAVLYFTLRKPKAARVYLEAVIVEYPDTIWARVALLDKARSFAAEGARALAEGEYQRLMELYPGTEEARTAAAEVAAMQG